LAMPQQAKIEQARKRKKAPIHRRFRRYDPSKSPTRFPEDPYLFSLLAALALTANYRPEKLHLFDVSSKIDKSASRTSRGAPTSFLDPSSTVGTGRCGLSH
jgi:hypothetical protein